MQTGHYYLAAVLLGACWHQITFVVHDAGHAEVFGDYHADRVLGCLIASWFGGLSCGWWCDVSDARSCFSEFCLPRTDAHRGQTLHAEPQRPPS